MNYYITYYQLQYPNDLDSFNYTPFLCFGCRIIFTIFLLRKMARTKQTARASNAPRKASSKGGNEPEVGGEYGKKYEDFDKEVDDESDDEGEDVVVREDDDGNGSFGDSDSQEKPVAFMLFDFRAGSAAWPANVEYVNHVRGQELLETAEKAMETELHESSQEEKSTTRSVTIISTTMDATNSDDDTTEPYEVLQRHELPSETQFEILKDGSSALIVNQGCRLKINLEELLVGGDALREKRKAEEEKERKRLIWPLRRGAGPLKPKRRGGKEYVNEYTITMDIRLAQEVPSDGFSLFQTALVHSNENKRSGDTLCSSQNRRKYLRSLYCENIISRIYICRR